MRSRENQHVTCEFREAMSRDHGSKSPTHSTSAASGSRQQLACSEASEQRPTTASLVPQVAAPSRTLRLSPDKRHTFGPVDIAV